MGQLSWVSFRPFHGPQLSLFLPLSSSGTTVFTVLALSFSRILKAPLYSAASLPLSWVLARVLNLASKESIPSKWIPLYIISHEDYTTFNPSCIRLVPAGICQLTLKTLVYSHFLSLIRLSMSVATSLC